MSKKFAPVFFAIILMLEGCASRSIPPKATSAPFPPGRVNASIDDPGTYLIPLFCSLTSVRKKDESVIAVLTETNLGTEETSLRCTLDGENDEFEFYAYDITTHQWVLKNGKQNVPNCSLMPGVKHRWHPRVFGGGFSMTLGLKPGDSHSHDYVLNKYFGFHRADHYAVYVTDGFSEHVIASCIVHNEIE